jgi:hypothetical protein
MGIVSKSVDSNIRATSAKESRMLKYVLLATTVAIASPAFAQDAPAPATTVAPQEAPVSEPAAPVTDAAPAPAEAAQPTANPQPATAAAQPTPAQPATEAEPAAAAAAPAQPAAAQPATAAALPAPGEPATNATQVAAVVTQEFPKYDQDSSGSLDKTEFGTWMVALRKAAQPAFQPGSAEANTWLGQAFTQADTDKNATINQGELTVFLSPKPAA